MEKHYTHLQAEDRAGIMLMLSEGYSQRHIARHLGRSPSSISREIRRHGVAPQTMCCPVTMRLWPDGLRIHASSSHDDHVSWRLKVSSLAW
jgi:hypothetical protein